MVKAIRALKRRYGGFLGIMLAMGSARASMRQLAHPRVNPFADYTALSLVKNPPMAYGIASLYSNFGLLGSPIDMYSIRNFSQNSFSDNAPGHVRAYRELLNVRPGASVAAIKKAYHEKVLLLHPDLNKAPDANEQFQQLQGAYDLLIGYAQEQARDNVRNKLEFGSEAQFNDLAEIASPAQLVEMFPAQVSLQENDGYIQSVRNADYYYKTTRVTDPTGAHAYITAAYNARGERIGHGVHSTVTGGQQYLYLRSFLSQQSSNCQFEKDFLQEMLTNLDMSGVWKPSYDTYTGRGIVAGMRLLCGVWDGGRDCQVVVLARGLYNDVVPEEATPEKDENETIAQRIMRWLFGSPAQHYTRPTPVRTRPSREKLSLLREVFEHVTAEQAVPHSFHLEHIHVPFDEARVTFTLKASPALTRMGAQVIEACSKWF